MRIEQAISNGFEFRFGAYISEAFSLFGKAPAWYILYFFIIIAFSFASSFIGNIGLIGGLISMIFSFSVAPTLNAGFYTGSHAVANGDPSPMARFFDSMQQILHITLYYVVSGVVALMLSSIAIIPLASHFAGFPWLEAATGGIGDERILNELIHIMSSFSLLDGVLTFVLLIPSIVVSIMWSFAPAYIAVAKLSFWPAMECSRKMVFKHFFSLIGLFIVWGIIILISVIPLGLGLLVTVPALQAAMYLIFKDSVGNALTEQGLSAEDHLITEG